MSETWLKKEKVKISEVNIPGYALFRKDRPEGDGGGVLIYVKKSYSPKAFMVKTDDDWDTGLETVFAEIRHPQHARPLVVGAAYRPPHCKVDSYEHLGAMLQTLTLARKDVYLLGDFNCDFLNPGHVKNLQRSTRPVQLSSVCQQNQLGLLRKPAHVWIWLSPAGLNS